MAHKPTLYIKQIADLYVRKNFEALAQYLRDLTTDEISAARAAASVVATPETVTASTDAGVGLPSGVVVAFGGAEAPDGWLICDGRSFSQNLYPALFAAVGIAHGGTSSTFNIPDYRGRFLRGVDGGAATDPDRTTRTAAKPGGNAGDAVGSVQADALQGHYHTLTNGTAVARDSTSGTSNGHMGTTVVNTNYTLAVTDPITDGSHGTPRVASETRPVNSGVNWIIKT